MNVKRNIQMAYVFVVLTVLAGALMTTSVFAQKSTSWYNTQIPESIMTPDSLETRIGTFEFFDGIDRRVVSMRD